MVTDTRSSSLQAGGSGPYTSSNLEAHLNASSSLPASLSSVPLISPRPLYGADAISCSLVLPHCAQFSTSMYGSASVSPGLTSRGLTWLDPGGEDDEDDPEGVRVLLCIAPTLDRNTKENSLPFVLHCYSQWAVATLFEPLKVVQALRDQVIARFSAKDTRKRAILIANAMNMFAKKSAISGAGKSILNYLVLDVQKNVTDFTATPLPFVLEIDRHNATHKMDGLIEILSLQLNMQPTRDTMRWLAHAAPVFRRACPEPQGQPINLPNILHSPGLNLRYFATMDVFMSVLTGLPTHFPYQVPFSPDLFEQTYHWQLQGSYGLQWLYGIPDQLVMVFAWINTLSETPGASENTRLISWIEEQLPQIKIALDQSGDPSLRIGRMVVLECWRFAVMIYFYMACVLCKADSYDSRVVRTQKGFMRLLRGVKPGHSPEILLAPPTLVVGVATVEERDRDTLRQRILGVQEFAERRPSCNDVLPELEDIWTRSREGGGAAIYQRTLGIRQLADRGTGGNDLMLRLEDIWARTKNEGRAAMWTDLRVVNCDGGPPLLRHTLDAYM